MAAKKENKGRSRYRVLKPVFINGDLVKEIGSIVEGPSGLEGKALELLDKSGVPDTPPVGGADPASVQ